MRYALKDGVLAPTEKPVTVLSGMPITGDHPMHPFAIDAEGNLFVSMGSATNTCEVKNRMPHSPGNDPCTELETRAGIWRYDANKTDQVFSPKERYASGIRNGEGFDFDAAGRLFVTQHGRDQLHEDWPELYTVDQGFELPAEQIMILKQGAWYGWPKCYFDPKQKQARARRPSTAATGARRSGIARKPSRRSQPSRPTGRRTISRSTRRRSSPRAIAGARSSPSTARGTARPVRRAATTSCSSRWPTVSRPATMSSSPMDLPGRTRSPAAPCIGRRVWRSALMALST